MALAITEDWVRERVQLKHSNLEDVRSLSLPGTYHEKITAMGSGLRNFARLKHLDLSRNAIESLQGLENLKMLEKLNLYYNNIGGLQELFRLRQNQKLQDLDLRLNPVARNEPDYRLFLIHMLPNLRRLDDRAVRDNERKAALMHFSTEQAASIGEPPRRPPPITDPQTNPRVEHIRTLAKPVTVLDDDDANLLDFIARSSAETNLVVTGSSSTGPTIKDYPPQSVRRMNVAGIGLTDRGPTSTYGIDPPTGPSSEKQINLEDRLQRDIVPGGPYIPKVDCFHERYPNIPLIVATPASPKNTVKSGKDNGTKKNRVQFADDPNLQFQDEIDAYTSYKAHGQFTPNPATGSSSVRSSSAPPSSALVVQGTGGLKGYSGKQESNEEHEGEAGVEFYSKPPTGSNVNEVEFYDPTDPVYYNGNDLSAVYQELPSTHSVAPSSITAASSAFHAGNTLLSQDGLGDSILEPADPLVCRISDLVDRYWNGAKSLQSSQKFKELFNKALKENLGPVISRDMENEKRVEQLEEEVTCLRAENMALRQQTAVNDDMDGMEETKIKSSLIRAQRDLSILRSRLQMAMDENRGLQDRVAQLEVNAPAHPNDDSIRTEELERFRKENENLRHEITTMGTRMKQSSQLQELATMLQDSHKSLVQTNEHLLRELEETRSRHDQEVRQLHWSYDQLKKSVGYSPHVGSSSSSVPNGKASL